MKLPLIIESIQDLQFGEVFFTIISCKGNYVIILTEGKLIYQVFVAEDILTVVPTHSKVQKGVTILTDPEIIIPESFILREDKL